MEQSLNRRRWKLTYVSCDDVLYAVQDLGMDMNYSECSLELLVRPAARNWGSFSPRSNL